MINVYLSKQTHMLTLTRSLLLNKHSPKQKMLENKLFSKKISYWFHY